MLNLGRQLDNVVMFAAPTMVRRLVDAAKKRGENGEGLRTIIYGGGPMYLADIRDAIATMGQRFVQIYGQGESPMTITALSRDWHRRTEHPRYLERLSSVGTAQSVMRVRITGTDGKPLPPGETGEVEAKGAAVMLGYWNNPKANAETLKDGWLRTGDVGRLDEDGFLTLSDRSKDVIISGGTNIYPREVEEALLTHPDVREVSAIGVPDPDWGEIVVACVVLEAGRCGRRRHARRPLPGLDRALQAPEALRLSRGVAEEQLRQGAEDGAAGDDEEVMLTLYVNNLKLQ